LVPQDTSSDFAGNCPSSRICLRVQKGNVIRKREGGKERKVDLDRCKEEIEDVRLCRRRMQVSTVRILCDFLISVG